MGHLQKADGHRGVGRMLGHVGGEGVHLPFALPTLQAVADEQQAALGGGPGRLRGATDGDFGALHFGGPN